MPAMDADARVRFRVVANEDGMMLRQLLCRRFADLGAQAAAALIKAGGVYMGTVRVRIPSVRVVQGERITVYRRAAAAPPIAPDELRILRRGPDFVVVDKPAGAPASSTRASSQGTVAQALIHQLGEAGILRPYVGPVRPLPPEAGGLVLFTFRGQDALSIHQRFLDAAIEATDLLWVRGEAPATMRCEEPLLLTRSGRLKVAEPGVFGAFSATTSFRRLALRGSGDDAASLLEATSESGAGGQALAHAAALGFPPLHAPGTDGDPYRDDDGDGGELLFARVGLRFRHPESGEAIAIRLPDPPWAAPSGADADHPGGATGCEVTGE